MSDAYIRPTVQRRGRAATLTERLRDWMVVTRTKLLDKARLAQAIDYALSNWVALTRYCEDGRLDIDNTLPAPPRAIIHSKGPHVPPRTLIAQR